MPTSEHKRIDAHHHLWNYNDEDFGWISDDMAVLRESFLAKDLARTMSDAEISDAAMPEGAVSGTVAIQARCCLEENEFLLAQAARSQEILGVVGWIDLKAPNASTILALYAASPYFKGVREITQGAADEAYFTNAAFNDGIREVTELGLTYDLLIFQDQLPAATAFVDAHPHLRFVLDHAAKPEIRADSFPEVWEKGIFELSKRDNVCCKLSGLVTEIRDEGTWDDDIFSPYFEVLLEAFSPARLMFGSDWPVSLTQCDYARWLGVVASNIASLSESEQDMIFGETAKEFYSL